MSNSTLLLFLSQPLTVSGLRNTAFSVTPTEFTEANAAEIFKFDHTPIAFKGGHCLGDNFEYAMAIPFDIDNSYSDNYEDWVKPDEIAGRLEELGINYWMAASRNHLLPKEGKAPRPKFHVYLPLSRALTDGAEFVRRCEWCIETFRADVKVKSKAQKIFGYGDNPNAFVKSWNEGQYLDELATELQIAPKTPPIRKSRDDTAFARFADSSEWESHLGDLEEMGWVFFERSGVLYFQTPDGDHEPGKQDGNIKDGVAYFFSKAPAPFENDKGYTICQLFAGVLFGDIGKGGLAKFAGRYSDDEGQTRLVLNLKKPLRSADIFIATLYTINGIPTLIHYADDYWLWQENAYRKVETGEVRSKLLHFLESAEIKKGDDFESFPIKPNTMNSIEDLLKRRIFRPASDAIPCWIGEASKMPSSVTDPSLLIFGKSTILNLVDMGTLPPSPQWYSTAALDFDFDASAECPQWLAFLDSIFGSDEESKQTLMEWFGLCLTHITKFQKALFILGKIRSGKGTIGRILRKVVGEHNAVSPKTSHFGTNFGLQSFIGKTLAVVSDARFAMQFSPQVIEGVLNITGEDPITIDRKFKEALTIQLRTKLTFLSNDVPNIIDQSGAFASRFIFLKLPNSFYGKEDVELEVKLSTELPGILRLAIRHLKILLDRGKFNQPEGGKKAAERMMSLSSPVSDFMLQLKPYMSRNEILAKWTEYCFSEVMGHGTKKELWNNLESAGYNCDFDAADILARIREHGGESTVQKLKDSFNKYHVEEGSEALKAILDRMVKAGRLKIRVGDYNVEYYSIAGEFPQNPYANED